MKFVLVSFFVLILGFIKVLEPLRGPVQYLFTPMQLGLSEMALEIRDSAIFYLNINDLRGQNIHLMEEVEDLKSVILELKEIQEENTVLKEQLSIGESSGLGSSTRDKNIQMANVLGNPTDLSETSVILDKGRRQGVSERDNVVVGRFLVGIIEEVFEERSLVKLLTSPDVSIAVMDVDSANKTEGISSGDYGTAVVMKRILPNEEIRVGDYIVTSGKDGKFFPFLGVGRVREISQVEVEPLKSAVLDTFVNVSKVRKVFILNMK
ncbi:MAG TPA: rod shape-determining protein MreC [Patescibacteria group bacterium]|nr:rod shape-determining protein MreC [Patescibacteria group bacterium]